MAAQKLQQRSLPRIVQEMYVQLETSLGDVGSVSLRELWFQTLRHTKILDPWDEFASKAKSAERLLKDCTLSWTS